MPANRPELRGLVQAALVTGARCSELSWLEVSDFNPDAGTVRVGQSKSGKAREIILNDEGTAFFLQQCLGRAGHEVIFQHAYKPGGQGGPWRTSEQAPLTKAACERARLTPRISFHGTAAHMGLAGGDERCAADGGGAKPRAPGHDDGGAPLRPPRA